MQGLRHVAAIHCSLVFPAVACKKRHVVSGLMLQSVVHEGRMLLDMAACFRYAAVQQS